MRFLKHSLIAFSALALLAPRLSAQQPIPAEGDEAQLIAVLESDAELFDKAKVCQRLAVIGTSQCVPALAALLDDDQLSHYARTGLEANPDPSVDVAFRAALEQLEGGHLVGVINSIGMRRDVEAIDALQELLTDSDVPVAAAAAGALGHIATGECVDSLRGALAGPASLQPAVADACLAAAYRLIAEENGANAAELLEALQEAATAEHLQTAARLGVIRARGATPLMLECLRSDHKALFQVGLRMGGELPGAQVTQALVDWLRDMHPLEDSAPQSLLVVKAEYGAEGAWVDLTDKLAAEAWGGSLSVTPGAQLAGDPAPGKVKQLRLEYLLDGQRHKVTVPEGQTLKLGPDQVDLPYPRQALVLHVLGARGDKAALPVVLELASSHVNFIRLAAIRVAGELGDGSAVPVLLAAAVNERGLPAIAARESLVELTGDDVDDVLETMLSQSEGRAQLALIDLVGRRGITSAAPALSKLADGDDARLSLAAIGALGSTVELDGLSALIDRLLAPETPEITAAVKEALRKACLRMPDRDVSAAKLLAPMVSASMESKADLLDLLGVVGGPAALEGVSAAAQSGDSQVADAATRVLGGWMTADAAPVLLELATSGPEAFRVRCLRGYIRIPRQLKVDADQRLAMCRKALAAAGRDEEKRLVLEVAARYPSVESLAIVAPYLDEDTLKASAAAAAVVIAQKIGVAHPAAILPVMEKAIDAAGDTETSARARGLRNRARRAVGR